MEFEVHNIGFQHLGCGFGLGAIRVAHRLGAVAWRRRWGLDNGFGVGSRWLRAGKKAEKPWSPGRVGGRSHAQAGAGCRGPDRLGLAGAFRLELGAVPIGLLAVWRGLTRPGMGSAGFSGLAATGCSAQGVVAGRHTGGCGSAFGLGGGARRQRRGASCASRPGALESRMGGRWGRRHPVCARVDDSARRRAPLLGVDAPPNPVERIGMGYPRPALGRGWPAFGPVDVGFTMRGWWMGLALFGTIDAGAQTAEGPVHPWVLEAVGSGCLSPDGAEALAVRGWPGAVPQQGVVQALGMPEGERVLRCLLASPIWRERLEVRPTGGNVLPATRAVFRWGGGKLASIAGWRASGRLRHEEGSWRLQASGQWDGGASPHGSVTVTNDGTKGRWGLGALMPKVGQGALIWSSGVWEGVGGMEGAHRIPRGWIESGSRLRGALDGLGWKRFSSPVSALWSVEGAMAGRWWQGEPVAAAWGMSPGPDWVVRLGRSLDGRWQPALGLHGGGEWRGWSGRWAVAGFSQGWVGRTSVLRSWTRHREAHMVVIRAHPLHPAEWSGERQAAVSQADARPQWQCEAGLAWRGLFQGHLRWRRRMGLGPEAEAVERTFLQLDRSGHRLRVQMEATPGLAGSQTWRLRYRHEKVQSHVHESLRFRLHFEWACAPGGSGGACAVTCRYDRDRKARWTAGMGQAWGPSVAPARYVTGWDDRPAQAFRGQEAHAFLRWRGPDGRWQGRIRLAWTPAEASAGPWAAARPWLDVEFHPHRARRPPR